ncbi:MAG: apolipoprotein N-acyltransferase [Armatimonadetes bacterium RBG_19FT_COMBO_69_19]|nr:MAG: apolipoprotein N-acyltransferase [Armatimonadetes bacterium RBG_19FT_COMBO_69_19]
MSRQGRIALAAASGILLYAAFPPLDLGWFAWIALVPLLIALEGEAPSRAFVLGVVGGAIAYLGILSWMRVFGILPWLLLAAYLSLFTGVFAWGWRWISDGRPALLAVWTVPLLWTALEYLRSIGVMGFPWALLGLTQYRAPAVIHVAMLTGVFGVSFVVALSSAVVASRIAGRRIGPLLLSALVVATIILWGRSQVPPPASGDLPVAAVQPNVASRLKFDPLYASRYMEALRRLVAEAGRQGAALIVLPETAVPYNLFGPAGVLREIGGWANRARATLIASSMENGVSNIAVAVAPSGDAVSRYDKVRLVAFGEYGVRPGTRHEPLWTPLGRVGVAICFESIFPDVGRALVRGGADVLAVITNDGWFDGTSGGAQHAAQASLRAVETGRWVIRAANTGLTVVIDPAGRIRGGVPARTEAVLVSGVSLAQGETFYARFGDLFALVALFGLAATGIPRMWTALVADARTGAVQQSAAAAGLPLIAVWLLIGRAPGGIWPGVLLAFVVVFSALRPRREWGFAAQGFGATLVAGLAVAGTLFAALALAFRAYGIPVAVPVPPGGWIPGAVRQLVIALAIEGWLRGVAFTPLEEWKGRVVAVAVGTAAGMLLQRGLGAEAIAWAMVTGAAFGAIRARTGNALGLVVPHAVGNLLFSIVTLVR